MADLFHHTHAKLGGLISKLYAHRVRLTFPPAPGHYTIRFKRFRLCHFRLQHHRNIDMNPCPFGQWAVCGETEATLAHVTHMTGHGWFRLADLKLDRNFRRVTYKTAHNRLFIVNYELL